jgi:hypothetical protein
VKALYCRACGDIRAPDRGGAWTGCACGANRVRWADPERGLLEALGDPATLRVIGIDNRFLAGEAVAGQMNEDWRSLHDGLIDSAEGYVFARSQRACPVAIMRVGQTRDISWGAHGDHPEA